MLYRKVQNSRPTCFSVINALAIRIRVYYVRYTNPFEDWRPAGVAIMLELLDNIHWRSFPLINLLSKLEWNRWGMRTVFALNCSNAEVKDVDVSDNILYIQLFLLRTSTRSRTYWCPPKATQLPNTMSIWNLSRYWRRFLMVFPLGGLATVAKETIVDGRRT